MTACILCCRNINVFGYGCFPKLLWDYYAICGICMVVPCEIQKTLNSKTHLALGVSNDGFYTKDCF